VAEFFRSLNGFDLLVVLFLFLMFVAGFAQGTIRRILGIAAILFSFLLASQLRDPVGGFLAQNWTQFPAEYSHMIAYLTVFIGASVAFSVVIQGFYKRTPLFERYDWIDEVLGGLLGLVQGALIIGCFIVILDSFFKLSLAPDSDEYKILRDIFNAYDPTTTAQVFRQTLIPGFLVIFGFMIPQNVRDLFPR
jgi:uncharacterized membrane protein required for colicin V production